MSTSTEDRRLPPRPGSEANYARAYRLSGDAAKSETAAAETLPSCPPSAVHDMILTWTDSAGSLLVFPGDLVAVGRTLECVTAIAYEPPEDEAVRVELAGWDTVHCESPGNLVAVRRYDVEN
jgi:hypothetical protein